MLVAREAAKAAVAPKVAKVALAPQAAAKFHRRHLPFLQLTDLTALAVYQLALWSHLPFLQLTDLNAALSQAYRR